MSGLDRIPQPVLLCPDPSEKRRQTISSMTETGHTVHVDLPSLFEMIDLVQAVVDQLCRMLEFDEDSRHWVEVAVREYSPIERLSGCDSSVESSPRARNAAPTT